MEFGYIDIKASPVDFKLPEDPEQTIRTLNAAHKADELRIYVGATKWTEKRWVEKIYPKKTPEIDYLKLYADNFGTIEFGPTFYSIQKPEAIAAWREKVSGSPDFKFCPKFPQTITHHRRLNNAQEATAMFYQSISAFGNHLGPLLLQMGESFSPTSFLQLKAYLESLPPAIPLGLEVRHQDWFADHAHRTNLFNLLARLNISWIMSDTNGRRDAVHMHLSTPDVIIRFVGNNLDQSDYSRIDEWVERFAVWKEKGLQSIWFFVHQFDESVVPDLCDYLIKRFNSELGTRLKRPGIIDRGGSCYPNLFIQP